MHMQQIAGCGAASTKYVLPCRRKSFGAVFAQQNQAHRVGWRHPCRLGHCDAAPPANFRKWTQGPLARLGRSTDWYGVTAAMQRLRRRVCFRLYHSTALFSIRRRHGCPRTSPRTSRSQARIQDTTSASGVAVPLQPNELKCAEISFCI